MMLKPAWFIRTDAHTKGEIVIENGQLIIKKQHIKPIYDIQAWTSAFIIQMSIYLENFRDKTQDMLRYMCIIYN